MLVTMQASGAHLHYCFDGAAPSVSLHYLDEQTAGHAIEKSHSDLVVPMGSSALLKKIGSGQDPTDVEMPAVAAPLPSLQQVPAASRIDFIEYLPAAPRWFAAKPPARGPPR